MFLVFAGFSGSGKSYLAKRISKKLNCPYLNSDKIRKDIAQIATTKHVFQKFGKGLYSKKMTELTYNNLFNKGKKLLENNKFVIIDATFTSQEMQKKLLDSGVDFIFFWCHAPDEIIKNRLEKRLHDKKNISDATWEIYLKQKENFKGLIIPENKVIKIDTSSNEAFEKVFEVSLRLV